MLGLDPSNSTMLGLDPFYLKTPPRGVDDGIPPLGPPPKPLAMQAVPSQKCLFGLGASCCVTRSLPTPPSGCRGFEYFHADKPKAPHLVRYGAFG